MAYRGVTRSAAAVVAATTAAAAAWLFFIKFRSFFIKEIQNHFAARSHLFAAARGVHIATNAIATINIIICFSAWMRRWNICQSIETS